MLRGFFSVVLNSLAGVYRMHKLLLIHYLQLVASQLVAGTTWGPVESVQAGPQQLVRDAHVEGVLPSTAGGSITADVEMLHQVLSLALLVSSSNPSHRHALCCWGSVPHGAARYKM